MIYAREVLAVYPTIERRVRSLEEMIKRRCIKSFSALDDAEKVFEKVEKISEEKETLLDLKRKIDKVFSRLTEEENALIAYKYFKIEPKIPFAFSKRSYFRKQRKTEEKLEEYLSFAGLDEESFFKKYSRYDFINCICADVERREKKAEIKRALASDRKGKRGSGELSYADVVIGEKASGYLFKNYSSSR